jgi:hypothetical protein
MVTAATKGEKLTTTMYAQPTVSAYGSMLGSRPERAAASKQCLYRGEEKSEQFYTRRVCWCWRPRKVTRHTESRDQGEINKWWLCLSIALASQPGVRTKKLIFLG